MIGNCDDATQEGFFQHPINLWSLIFDNFFSAEEKQKSWKECEEMQQKSKKAKSCAFVRAAKFSSFIIHSDLGKKGLLLKNDGNVFISKRVMEDYMMSCQQQKAHRTRIKDWASWSDASQMSSTNVVEEPNSNWVIDTFMTSPIAKAKKFVDKKLVFFEIKLGVYTSLR